MALFIVIVLMLPITIINSIASEKHKMMAIVVAAAFVVVALCGMFSFNFCVMEQEKLMGYKAGSDTDD
jgi:uncharacterized transporter YbjL